MTVEDPDVVCSVVDNVLLLHLLNCDRTVLYDVGLSTAQSLTSGSISPRVSVDVHNLLEAGAQRQPPAV